MYFLDLLHDTSHIVLSPEVPSQCQMATFQITFSLIVLWVTLLTFHLFLICIVQGSLGQVQGQRFTLAGLGQFSLFHTSACHQGTKSFGPVVCFCGQYGTYQLGKEVSFVAAQKILGGDSSK